MTPQPEAEAAPVQHRPTADLIELAQETVQEVARQGGLKGWTMSRQQRRAAERIAETLRRNAAEHERQQRAAVIPPIPADSQPLAAQA